MEKLADVKSMPQKLQMFLFQYHITPQSFTDEFPSELLMNRKLTNRLNIIKLDTDSHEVSRNFEINENVWVRNFNLRGKYIFLGKLQLQPVQHNIWFQRKQELCGNVDHLRKRRNYDIDSRSPLTEVDYVIPPQGCIRKTMNDPEDHQSPPSLSKRYLKLSRQKIHPKAPNH